MRLLAEVRRQFEQLPRVLVVARGDGEGRILVRTVSSPPDPPLPSTGAYLGWHPTRTKAADRIIQRRIWPPGSRNPPGGRAVGSTLTDAAELRANNPEKGAHAQRSGRPYARSAATAALADSAGASAGLGGRRGMMIIATAATISTAASAPRPVSTSPASAQPMASATTGFTNA